MNSYIVDTNALLGYITDSPKLSRRASQAFDEGARGHAILYLPAIVIAELYYANVKLGYPFDFQETYRQISAASQFVLLPFEPSRRKMYSPSMRVRLCRRCTTA